MGGKKPNSIETQDVAALLAVAGIGYVIVTGSPCDWLTARLLEHGLSKDQAAALSAGLCTSAALSYGMQFVNFALSRFSIADNFTGLVEFLPAALIGLATSGTLHPRQVLLTAMLSSWSLRLGLFLLGRMQSRSGPDGRMNSLRAMSGVVKVGLLGFWIVHGTWVRGATQLVVRFDPQRPHTTRLSVLVATNVGPVGFAASHVDKRHRFGHGSQCDRCARGPRLQLLQRPVWLSLTSTVCPRRLSGAGDMGCRNDNGGHGRQREAGFIPA